MDIEKWFNIESLAGQQVPKDIVDQIKVLGRVKFPLKQTTVSAVSTSGEEEESSDEIDSQLKLSGMIDHVGEMENITSQLEDMLDELTKNMNIPVNPGSKALSDAVALLSGDDSANAITKDIFDKALAIVDHSSIMLIGQDPVLAAMTGNGKLDGPYMNCDEVSRGVAKAWNTADPKNENSEAALRDSNAEIQETFEDSKRKLSIEILLMLWWNFLWPKFIIMLVIVNPLRTQCAYPIDKLITFFKNMKKECGKGSFRKKDKECIKNYGPLNKLLNKLACFLLCKIPPKLYKRYKYKPNVSAFDFKILKDKKLYPCDCAKAYSCPPEDIKEQSFNSKGDWGQLENLLDNMADECTNVDDFLEGVKTEQPTGLGLPPNCVGAAQVILSAVMSDALSPEDTVKTTTTTSSVSSILSEQDKKLGVV